MEVEVKKESACINKLICEKRELVFIEEDMIVPDSKPDILKSINVSGNVCILKKEVLDGRVKLDGTIDTYIMYLPDSNNEHLRGLNAIINFSKSIQLDEAKEGMKAYLDINIKDLECKVLNGRKINVKAGLEINLKLYLDEKLEFVNKINNISDVQTLEKNIEINSLIGSNATRVYVKDTLNIDSNDEIMDILKLDISLINNDVKISYNKVLSKCDVELKIIYLTKDGRVGSVKGKIPSVGFIDIQNIKEDNVCETKNELKNILIRNNSPEEHSIYVEVEIESSCIAYEKKEISMILDLYSPVKNLSFSQKKIITSNQKISKMKDFTITDKINIPDLADGNLLDVEVSPEIINEKISNSKINYEGELILNFIFEKGEQNIYSNVSKIPFEISIDNPTDSKNIKSNSLCYILDKKFNVTNVGEIDCNIDIECVSNITQNISFDVIDDVEINENRESIDDYDSLILYIVMPGDTLWKIAKKFKSTIEDIKITNGLEDENKIYPGQKLYIPKFSYSNSEIV